MTKDNYKASEEDHYSKLLDDSRIDQQDALVLIEKMSLEMERGIHLIFGVIDQLVDLAKFLISLGATGFFAAISINSPNFESDSLKTAATIVVTISIIALVALLLLRIKLAKPHINQFISNQKVLITLTNLLTSRFEHTTQSLKKTSERLKTEHNAKD